MDWRELNRAQSITKDQVPSPLDWIHLSPGGAAKPAACVGFHVRAWLCSSYLCDGDLSFDDPCQTFGPPFHASIRASDRGTALDCSYGVARSGETR